jgi:beta-phosphoglucomutase
VNPVNCVVFEDALAGIEAANNAGMTSIGIGDAEVLSKADFNFNDFTEIDLDFLTELVQKR